MKIHFDPNNPNRHKCVGKLIGNILTYTCPKCEGWERSFNLLTGEMKASKIARESSIAHSSSLKQYNQSN